MSIIEAVRKYLQTCPLLKGGTLNVDFLPPEAATYSVDVVPVKPVLKAYMDGSSQRQFLFALATRTYYGEFVRQQNRTRSFPDLGDGRNARKLEVTTSGYVFAPDTDTARYQIQCRLSYFQKGE